MSAAGAAAGGAGPPLGGFDAVGPQAQSAILLQLLARITIAIEGGNSASSLFGSVIAFTAVGNLDIGAAYPNLKSGVFSIRKTIAAPTTVTLPPQAGLWIVCDGNGGAAANNITVAAPGGYTILGAASFILTANWQAIACILDAANFLIF